MKNEHISIHEFQNYREYLIAQVQLRKRKRQVNWSSVARDMGLSDTSSLTKIIHGQRHPGEKIIDSMIRYFELGENEAKYFRALILASKSREQAALARDALTVYLEESRLSAVAKPRIVQPSGFAALSNIAVFAIREMVRMVGFRPNIEWISKRLRAKLTKKDVDRALDSLIRLRLVKVDTTGKFTVSDERFVSDSAVPNEAVRQFHESALDEARRAIREVDLSERELRATVIAVPASKLSEARTLIQEFHQRFEALIESPNGEEVYSLQTQFYPLTRFQKEKV